LLQEKKRKENNYSFYLFKCERRKLCIHYLLNNEINKSLGRQYCYINKTLTTKRNNVANLTNNTNEQFGYIIIKL